MNIYKISQEEVNGYDTYSDAVVIAPDEETARKIYPCEYSLEIEFIPKENNSYFRTWTNNPDKVKVEFLGTASKYFNKIQIICSSFHAG